jgi:uncharacterized coiled-coil protein SlyX
VSIEIPNHQDILDRLHAHDLRLTRVEVQQSAMASEIADQTTKLEKLADKLEKLADKIHSLSELASGLDARQKLILAVITIGIPAILGLEIWAGLRR